MSKANAGRLGAIAVRADFLGNGIKDVVHRQGNQISVPSMGLQFNYGGADDDFFVADFRGTGRADVAVRRGNTFYVLWNENLGKKGAADFQFSYGNNDDDFFVAPFRGTSQVDIAIRRGNAFYVIWGENLGKKGTHDFAFSFGNGDGDYFAEDFRGTGRADLAWRSSFRFYVIWNENLGKKGTHDFQFDYGNGPSDVYFAGDFRGVGRSDVTVYRNKQLLVKYQENFGSGTADSTFKANIRSQITYLPLTDIQLDGFDSLTRCAAEAGPALYSKACETCGEGCAAWATAGAIAGFASGSAPGAVFGAIGACMASMVSTTQQCGQCIADVKAAILQCQLEGVPGDPGPGKDDPDPDPNPDPIPDHDPDHTPDPADIPDHPDHPDHEAVNHPAMNELSRPKPPALQSLATKMQASSKYLSKIQSQSVSVENNPSDDLIARLHADLDDLLLQSDKIPDVVRKRVMQRPAAFLKIAQLNDRALDKVLAAMDHKARG